MLFDSTIHVKPSGFFAHNTCRLVLFIQPLRVYFTLLGMHEEIIYCKEYYNKNNSVDVLFLRYAFEQENLLTHTYASTKVYIDTDFCIIPDRKVFFKERFDFARVMLDEHVSEDDLYYYPLPESDTAGLFIPPSMWIKLLNEYLPAYELSSSSDLLIRLGKLLHNSLKPLLLLQILDTHVNILGFKRDRLEFMQRYSYKTALDLVYFIQLAKNQLNKKGPADVYAVGEIEENSPGWEEVQKYFPKLKFPLSLIHRSRKNIDSPNWWKYTYMS